uniref:Leucine rich repeat containing 2 n=1 Tax=Myripristis murdjan TaxID=586833 RepID=A0A667XCV8_9TELE
MRADVPVYDLSLIRGLWEVRVKKYRHKQKKEQERIEKSALARSNTRPASLIHGFTDQLLCLINNLVFKVSKLMNHAHGLSENELDGDKWMDFPKELQWMTYMREWHVRGTRICRLPEYLPLFSELTVLELPKNALGELPAEIGKLSSLKELNVSYNRLSRVPPELGDCENLERLELTGNRNLSELPFELSGLKKLVHLDIAENRFASIPICTLRMSSLQLLDMSNNQLTDLPEDMDRLEQLVSLFIHKNKLSYLPHCLTRISTLKMIVVSGDELNSIPTKLCSNPDIKKTWRGEEEEAYIDCLKERGESTTKNNKVLREGRRKKNFTESLVLQLFL